MSVTEEDMLSLIEYFKKEQKTPFLVIEKDYQKLSNFVDKAMEINKLKVKEFEKLKVKSKVFNCFYVDDDKQERVRWRGISIKEEVEKYYKIEEMYSVTNDYSMIPISFIPIAKICFSQPNDLLKAISKVNNDSKSYLGFIAHRTMDNLSNLYYVPKKRLDTQQLKEDTLTMKLALFRDLVETKTKQIDYIHIINPYGESEKMSPRESRSIEKICSKNMDNTSKRNIEFITAQRMK